MEYIYIFFNSHKEGKKFYCLRPLKEAEKEGVENKVNRK